MCRGPSPGLGATDQPAGWLRGRFENMGLRGAQVTLLVVPNDGFFGPYSLVTPNLFALSFNQSNDWPILPLDQRVVIRRRVMETSF